MPEIEPLPVWTRLRAIAEAVAREMENEAQQIRDIADELENA